MIFFYDSMLHLKEYDVIIASKRKKCTRICRFHSGQSAIASLWSLIIPKWNDVISYILCSLCTLYAWIEKLSGAK